MDTTAASSTAVVENSTASSETTRNDKNEDYMAVPTRAGSHWSWNLVEISECGNMFVCKHREKCGQDAGWSRKRKSNPGKSIKGDYLTA